MNDLTKELARKAGLIAPHGSDREGLADFDYRMFADLIIRECMNECRQEWYDTNNDPVINANKDPRMIGIKIGIKQGAIRCLDRIKKRFGAEA